MSTLKVGTIQSNTASTPPTIQDSAGTQVGTFCRAWVNFNGTGTVAIRASFNVTSITDNGTGDYTVNFTNAMPDANYSAVVTNAPTGVTDSSAQILTPAVGSLRVNSTNAAGSQLDTATFCVAIFR